MKTETTSHGSRSIRSLIVVGLFVMLAALVAAPNCLAEVVTFAADCATPRTTFVLGETVCARATDLDRFSLAWSNADGFILDKVELTSGSQTASFVLPTTGQSSIDGLFTANNLGRWRVAAITSRSSVKFAAYFTVRDPQNARVDLEIVKSVLGGNAPLAGENVQFEITVRNLGPDDALNTALVDDQYSNASFNSLSQMTGPSFSCSGNGCTIASFPNGATATFLADFTAGSAGGMLENTASISSDTVDLNPSSNTARSPVLKVSSGGTPPACNLECPNNIVVSANTTDNGTPGAIVNLPTVEGFGSCGTVNLSPPSGSFFPVGTSTVTATASGGGLCSYTVTVIETPPPTISCPANITVTAPSGQSSSFVPDTAASFSDPGVATGTGSQIVVAGERSDDQLLGDAYPVGVTLITWKATDDAGRTATCTQQVTVQSSDAPTITCPPDATFTAPPGSCRITVSESAVGTPVTGGTNVTVQYRRSDDLALADPYPSGTTVITWTATNSLGSASCTQRIVVRAIDNEAPVLTVPPDVTTSTSSCFVLVDEELGAATADDNCSESVAITRSGVPPNFVFPTGTTEITYTATDAAGNTTTGVQSIRVLEVPALLPSITPPAAVTVFTGTEATTCATVVPETTLGNAIATDNCPGVAVSRNGAPSDNVFPVGVTTLTHAATDRVGNTATATQHVTVIDNTPPLVTAPDAVTLYTGPGATSCDVHVADLEATLGTGSATDNCSAGVVRRSGVPANNIFPVGTTTVTYSSTDPSGNTSSATQLVTVIDSTAAVIICPPSATLEPTCPSGAIMTWAPPAGTDNCPNPSTAQSGGPASGSVFPIGVTTTVSFTATDTAGNLTSCSFTVTVLTVRATIEKLKASVGASSLKPPTMQGLIPKLDAALAGIDKRNQTQSCQTIAAFAKSVQSFVDHGDISLDLGRKWLASAAHVANALGCTSDTCS